MRENESPSFESIIEKLAVLLKLHPKLTLDVPDGEPFDLGDVKSITIHSDGRIVYSLNGGTISYCIGGERSNHYES